MFGFSESTWGAIGVIGAGASGVITFIYGRIAASDKKAHEAEMESLKTANKNTTDNLQRELERQDTSLEQAWKKIDELRENVVRKADLREYRAEVKQDMKDLGDRLEGAITALRNDIHRDRPGGQP